VKGVSIGDGGAIKLGEETVLYRHEKTFVNQTVFAVNVDAGAPAEKVDRLLAAVRDYTLERVGETIKVELICVSQKDAGAEAFLALARKAIEIRPLILKSDDAQTLKKAAAEFAGKGCVLASATPATAFELSAAATEGGHALGVTAGDIDELAATTASIKESGFNELILDFRPADLGEAFRLNSILRIAAIKDDCKSVGYPTLRVLECGDQLDCTAEAVTEISKYGGICVLPDFDPAQLSALMTLRLNVYTDPQKPIQVEPKVYPIGEPNRSSPVFLTTNFSLTYFIVSGEIENSGISAWLVVPECEGMSVLTAWAAGKFSGAAVGKFIKEIGLENDIDSRTLIIPGYVAQISGEIEEVLPGWTIMVGPEEAGDIESFVKQRL
ncbi:MAG: acetyl-CoA decarbonylase/synthase complex subunit gamma, partial [Planctomycetes bacterium]|nr:acetyl-CoA decarbonylase/synthase complex subunit gamma [Planctomycetota bacterium]